MPMHKAATGQDFEESGQAGFSCGQQGMLSDMVPISDIDASPIAALDGIAIGAVRRPTIARIESRRGMSDQTCTAVECHSAPHNRRGRNSRSCQDTAAGEDKDRSMGHRVVIMVTADRRRATQQVPIARNQSGDSPPAPEPADRARFALAMAPSAPATLRSKPRLVLRLLVIVRRRERTAASKIASCPAPVWQISRFTRLLSERFSALPLAGQGTVQRNETA